MAVFEECVLRQFKSGAFEHKKSRRGGLPSPVWPWPAPGVFSLKGDEGLSVDDGAIHSVKQMREVISMTRPATGTGFKNPDEYGFVALEKERLTAFGHLIPKPVQAGGSLPVNPAHSQIHKFDGAEETDFRADLWSIALGYEPPPAENVPDHVWSRWERIACYNAG